MTDRRGFLKSAAIAGAPAPSDTLRSAAGGA